MTTATAPASWRSGTWNRRPAAGVEGSDRLIIVEERRRSEDSIGADVCLLRRGKGGGDLI